MEQEIGFLYVLANSAMPGVVKVGKTTRSPAERAVELSGATGLPTPFIVVYEQLFEDCHAAERFVHVYLERNGYRIADNREFFNAPANLVVKAISLAPGALNGALPGAPAQTQTDDLLPARESDELDGLSLTSEDVPTYPWTAVLAEAEAHYYGLDDYIEDYAEAMRLFRQAAQLGSLSAYGFIGQMYQLGEGVREDHAKSLEFYKEGARKGSVGCYWRMGFLFILDGNLANAEKCFSLFLKNMDSGLPDGQRLTVSEWDSTSGNCVSMLSHQALPSVLNGFVLERLPAIRHRARTWLERSLKDSNYSKLAAGYRAVIEYLDDIERTGVGSAQA